MSATKPYLASPSSFSRPCAPRPGQMDIPVLPDGTCRARLPITPNNGQEPLTQNSGEPSQPVKLRGARVCTL